MRNTRNKRQLLHEVKREDKNIKERREEKQDPQEPDIPHTFMYAGREEVQMEGEDGESTQRNRRRKKDR